MIEQMTFVEALALLQHFLMRVDGEAHKDEMAHAMIESIPILQLHDEEGTGSQKDHIDAFILAFVKMLDCIDSRDAVRAAVIKLGAQPAAIKESVLKLLQGAAEVDGIVHPEEAKFINRLTAALQALGENEKGKRIE